MQRCQSKVTKAYFVQLAVEIKFSREGYLTKRISNDNVLVALEIRGHWYFLKGCQPDFSSDVNLIV